MRGPYKEKREEAIKLYNAIAAYYKGGQTETLLESIMLLSYSLSKRIREDDLDGTSNPAHTSGVGKLDDLLDRCIQLVDKNGVDPLVQANILEMVSRNAYTILKKSRY